MLRLVIDNLFESAKDVFPVYPESEKGPEVLDQAVRQHERFNFLSGEIQIGRDPLAVVVQFDGAVVIGVETR